MLPYLPPVPRVDNNSLDLELAVESSYTQHPKELLPVDWNWHKRWNLFIICAHGMYLGSFLPFHSISSLPLMLFVLLSLPSFFWCIFKAYSLAFYFFLFTQFFPEFTELRSVIVIPKSAFPAKSQIKSEFQVQISNCLQFHVVILPLLLVDYVWNRTHYPSCPNSRSFLIDHHGY